MKKILFLLIGSFLFFACKEAEADIYEGDTMLNFNNGTSRTEFVKLSTGSKETEISYGTTKAVSGNHEVKLVFDASKSTAVLGTDFEILDGTDDLTAGEVGGKFKLKIMEPAIGVSKTAVFRLESSSLNKAIFDQEFNMQMKLFCPASTFVGIFGVDTGLFGSFDVEIIEGTEPNTLIIKDYIESGYDITLTYDPDTGVVTFPQQPTGYINGSSGMIMFKQAIDGSVSTVDFCSRKMDLRVSYGTPTGGTYAVGGVSSFTEPFTGK